MERQVTPIASRPTRMAAREAIEPELYTLKKMPAEASVLPPFVWASPANRERPGVVYSVWNVGVAVEGSDGVEETA